MIVFIGCVKTKLNKESQAKNLYISDFFKKNLAYAKSLNPDKIFILSAKYGVLELDDIIKPYNKTLNNSSKKERKLWTKKCIKQLKNKDINFNQKVIFLAGKNYREYLKDEFTDIEKPLEGLGFGEQLRFLKKAVSRKQLSLFKIEN